MKKSTFFNVLYVGDQILRINEKPTYQKSKAELLKKMQELPVNFEACAAHQSWHILRIVRESNPGLAGHIDFVGPGSIPRQRKVRANFDKLTFSKWSQLIKTIAAL